MEFYTNWDSTSIDGTQPLNLSLRLDPHGVDVNGNFNVVYGSQKTAPAATIKQDAGSTEKFIDWQHFAQLQIQNNNSNNSSLVLAMSTDGLGIIQGKTVNVGYNDVVLNPIAGRVGIGKFNPVTELDVNGIITATNVYYTSDLRLKDNINDLSNSLEKICAIRGVEYTWKRDDTKKLQCGVIAQEVNMIIPEAVNTSNPDTLTVNYNAIIGHLIESIKTLKQEVDNLKSQLPRV